MKKAEREKQLADVEATQAKSRPKVWIEFALFPSRFFLFTPWLIFQSARAARSALGSHGRKKIDPKTLEIRKALAEKLKQEVINEDNWPLIQHQWVSSRCLNSWLRFGRDHTIYLQNWGLSILFSWRPRINAQTIHRHYFKEYISFFGSTNI